MIIIMVDKLSQPAVPQAPRAGAANPVRRG